MPCKILIGGSFMANNNVQFRSKFQKKVADCSDELQLKLQQCTMNFISMNNEACHEILWSMTYDPANAIKRFGMIIQPEQVSTEGKEEDKEPEILIPEELILPWRNELRYQRSIINKNFLVLDVPEGCQAAYQALLDMADPIITVAAYDACWQVCQYMSQENFERSLYLLRSPKEENFFGGIRSIGFTRLQASYLKPYASQLSNLLEALWNEECSRRIANANTPMREQLQQWLEKNNNGTEVVPADESPSKKIPTAEATVEGTPAQANESEEKQTPTESDGSTSQLPPPQKNPDENNPLPPTNSKNTEEATVNNEKAITVGNIYADEALFEKFLAICQELQEAGYDCKKVVDKLDAIAKSLEASKLLSE